MPLSDTLRHQSLYFSAATENWTVQAKPGTHRIQQIFACWVLPAELVYSLVYKATVLQEKKHQIKWIIQKLLLLLKLSVNLLLLQTDKNKFKKTYKHTFLSIMALSEVIIICTMSFLSVWDLEQTTWCLLWVSVLFFLIKHNLPSSLWKSERLTSFLPVSVCILQQMFKFYWDGPQFKNLSK